MPANLRIMVIDDVTSDADLKRYYEHNRKLINFFCLQFALTAAQLKAMLREHDKRSGQHRAASVARPIALAAGIMVLVSKYLALSARRFELKYQPELQAAGRARRRSRTLNFGD